MLNEFSKGMEEEKTFLSADYTVVTVLVAFTYKYTISPSPHTSLQSRQVGTMIPFHRWGN